MIVDASFASRGLVGACVGCAAMLACAGSGFAAWNQPVGGPSPINHATDGGSRDTTLRLIGGVPYIAWGEDDGVNGEARVSRLNAAGTAWEQVVGGASPINLASDRNALDPELAGIGGVPHVAWTEFDGVNDELRVARLNAAGTAWNQVVGGASPINHASDKHASTLDLTDVGGVPYVTWRESDGTNYEVRVSRLNAAGTAWEQVEGGPSPVNESPTHSADTATIATIGGVPYVAWHEFDGVNGEIRVSRLNAAGTAWEQVVGGASPINHSSTASASHPSLADVSGVPYVAWRESDGVNGEIRVSRLNAAGTAWEQVVGGASPINHSSTQNASRPSLTTIGGVPYVAWIEADGTNEEVRVSRLNAAGTAWEQVVGGASPINQASNQDSDHPSLTTIGGVPYVAWMESDGTNSEARVSRLEPEFTFQTAFPSATGATLMAGVHTYGIPYASGFQYGGALANETTTDTAAAGSENVTITKQVGGLVPATNYQVRAFATAGVPEPRVFGAIGAFTTLPATDGGTALATTDGGKTLADATAAVLSRYRLSPTDFLAASRGASIAGRRRRTGTRVSYTLSEPATVTFRIERAANGRRVGGRCRRPTRRNLNRRRCVRYVTLGGRFQHEGRPGPNTFRFTGRLQRRKLRPGRYRLRARPVDAAGNASPFARKKFRIVRR